MPLLRKYRVRFKDVLLLEGKVQGQMPLGKHLTNEADVLIIGKAVGCKDCVPCGDNGCMKAAQRGTLDQARIHGKWRVAEFADQDLLKRADASWQPVYLQQCPSDQLTILQQEQDNCAPSVLPAGLMGCIGMSMSEVPLHGSLQCTSCMLGCTTTQQAANQLMDGSTGKDQE